MKFRSLRLDGFLSFAPGSDPFELRALNVLIGPNAAGKSNLIEALGLLAATPTDLAGAVRKGGGSSEWIWKGVPAADSAEIDAVLEREHGEDIRYRLSLGSVQTRLEILDEAIEEAPRNPRSAVVEDLDFHYRFQRGDPVIGFKTVNGERTQRRLDRQDLLPDQSVLAQRRDPDQYPEVTEVGKTFSNILTFSEWTFGPHAPPRDPQRADLPEDRLLPDNSNLSLVLNQIELSGETRVNALLTRFFPIFERVSIRVSAGTAQLYFFEDGFRSPIPATRISDGTLRFVALLATLLSPSPPPVVCIEEPELGLHPDAMTLLAELLVEASQRMQLVVTTHSDALVSALTNQPDAIVTCERPGASTVLRRLDPAKLGSWLDDYRLGDLWAMGVLGANP